MTHTQDSAHDDTSPPAPGQEPVAEAESRSAGRGNPVWEWFWRGRALGQARSDPAFGPKEAQELLRRAWASFDLAESALAHSRTSKPDSTAWIACDLYRQSLYWSLRAAHSRTAVAETQSTEVPRMEALWDQCDPDLFARVEPNGERLEALRVAAHQSFQEFAEMPPEKQRDTARQLGGFSRRLATHLEAPYVAVDRLKLQRAVRSGVAMLLVALGVGLFAGRLTAGNSLEARDIASGKPWRASSRYHDAGCLSPQQTCPQSPYFFFHTNAQANPWLEIDLMSVQSFSAVYIKNRADCCAERAVPLVVEASSNRRNWTELARRVEPFTEWQADFPEHTARWVRVRALRRTMLHFDRVYVLK